MGWNVISVSPGFEQRVKNTIESSKSLENIDKRIIIPVVMKKTLVNGKFYFHNEKLFPGYIFVECFEDDYEMVFGYISSIIGVLNMSSIKNSFRTFFPIEEFEMGHVLKLMYDFDNSINKTNTGKSYTINDRIRITAGPFANFEGIISEVNYPANSEAKIKVCTRLFNNDPTFVVISEFQAELI